MIGILTNNSKSRSIINGSDRFANFNKTRDIPITEREIVNSLPDAALAGGLKDHKAFSQGELWTEAKPNQTGAICCWRDLDATQATAGS